MKHFILWGLTLAAVVLGGCSDDYDDTELRTGLNDLRDRVAKLETQLTKLNGEITTIDALVRKLESNVSVVKVEPGTDGKSYTIYFSDDTKAVIANGEDGVAGKDAPVIGVKEEDAGNSPAEIEKALRKEGEQITALLPRRAYVYALCVEGQPCSSEAFAASLERVISEGGEPVFVIGSSHGLSEAVKRAADRRLSFSQMTLPHRLMRVVLTEQIYRAMTIIHHRAYHK